MKKSIIYITLFFLMIGQICAYKTVLEFDLNNPIQSGVIFENKTFTTPEHSDLYFAGLSDKEEKYDKPNLYADVDNAAISFKGKVSCDKIIYSENYVEAIEGKEYCVRDKDGQNFYSIKVLDIDKDWKTIKININDKSANINLILFYILLDIVIIVLILFFSYKIFNFCKFKTRLKNKKSQVSMEFMIIISMLLILILFLFTIISDRNSEISSIETKNYAESLAKKLAYSVDEVFLSGDGAETYVEFPPTLKDGTVYSLGIYPQYRIINVEWGPVNEKRLFSYPIITSNISGDLASIKNNILISNNKGEIVVAK